MAVPRGTATRHFSTKLIVVLPEKWPFGGGPGRAARTIRKAAASSSSFPDDRTTETAAISPAASTEKPITTEPSPDAEIR